MNYNSELQRLKRLLCADHQAYLGELDKPWSGMDEDLDLTVRILLKHAAKSGGRLPLLTACNFLEGPRVETTVTLPEWWFESGGGLTACFESRRTTNFRTNARNFGGALDRLWARIHSRAGPVARPTALQANHAPFPNGL